MGHGRDAKCRCRTERSDGPSAAITAGHNPLRALKIARLAVLGSLAFAGAPSDFGKLIVGETEKSAKMVRAANIKAE
jgi:hypothetical protein